MRGDRDSAEDGAQPGSIRCCPLPAEEPWDDVSPIPSTNGTRAKASARRADDNAFAGGSALDVTLDQMEV